MNATAAADRQSPARRRVLLVLPDAGIHRLEIGHWRTSFREAPLTLTCLAALSPPELELSITLADESVQAIPPTEDFDLIGISCLTGTAHRGYEIADRARAHGSTVVLGGVHPTLRPDEAAAHADAVVVGFAERSWPQLLRDWAGGRLQTVYRDLTPPLEGLPTPQRELQRRLGYLTPNTVFATRGCKRSCDFCTVPALRASWCARPVGDVIEDIRTIRARRFVFNDVSLTEDREYALELFSAMVPLGKRWGGLAPVDIVKDQELLSLMARSGCMFLLVGFESLDPDGLAQIGKGGNRTTDYSDAVASLHRHGITVQGCFIFGLDSDDRSVFDRTVEAVNDLGIDIPRFAIYTPYPGTRAFKRLKSEGRILHEHWPHYDTQHVVFEPANMSPRELDEGFRRSYERAFSSASVARRLAVSPHFMVTLAGNLAYRLYLRRLARDVDRLHSGAPVSRALCLT